MKNLKIGQLVRVTAVAEVGYLDDHRRTVNVWPTEPFLALIVGQVVKYTGWYGGGRRFYDNYNYEPAFLKVDKAVTLWQVRTGMVNKPLMVCDNDLEPAEADFTLPRCAAKVNRVYADPPLDVRFAPPSRHVITPKPQLLTNQSVPKDVEFTVWTPALLTYQPEVFDG